MAQVSEFDLFVEECRKVGLADVKALEAAWSEFAELVPESARGRGIREQLMNVLKLGAEYARMEEQLKKGGTHHG